MSIKEFKIWVEKQAAASGGEGGSAGAVSTSTPGFGTITFGGDRKKKNNTKNRNKTRRQCEQGNRSIFFLEK